MALTLNPATKVISVPQADLTFISGTLYDHDTDQFRKDVFDLLSSEAYIWMEDAFQHNTEVTIVGVTYARLIEYINGFSITYEFTGSAYSVRLVGSNNNQFDVDSGVLNPTSLVTIIGQNSAGLQIVSSGSGLDAGQDAKLTSVEAKTEELWRTRGLEVGNPVTITPSGVDTSGGEIDLDLTGDGISSTVIERQP